MKSALKRLCCVGLLVGLRAFAQAAEKTWTGKISDSMCGASHAKMMGEHTGAKMTDRECTLACVKGGGKYVFVSGGNASWFCRSFKKGTAPANCPLLPIGVRLSDPNRSQT